MKRIAGTMVAVSSLLAAAPAGASGFLAARFGGEHGHPTTDNPTALYYNPAGLALSKGTRLYLDGTFALRFAAYTRPDSAIDSLGTGTPADAVGANSGEGDLTNFIASPFIAVTSDLGIENFGAAVGLYVPMGGSAAWDQDDEWRDDETYPGAVDGVQRWWTMDGTIQSMYVSAGLAYRLPGPRLSIGASFNMVQSKVHTVRARNPDGTDDLVLADGSLKEGRSFIDVDGWHPSIGAGIIWEPAENVWLGVSYQSQPGFGDIELEGELNNTIEQGLPSTTDVKLRQSLPDVWRFGGRFRPNHEWELRLFGEFARWSVFKDQCIIRADSDEDCSVAENGSAPPQRGIIQNIPRRWKDAFGVRAGVSHFFSESFEGWLGAGYDSNAVPDETLDPALMDMPKVTGAIGAGYAFLDNLKFQATFTQVIYFSREIDPEDTTQFEVPSRQPDAAGTYDNAISVLNLNLQYSF